MKYRQNTKNDPTKNLYFNYILSKSANSEIKEIRNISNLFAPFSYLSIVLNGIVIMSFIISVQYNDGLYIIIAGLLKIINSGVLCFLLYKRQKLVNLIDSQKISVEENEDQNVVHSGFKRMRNQSLVLKKSQIMQMVITLILLIYILQNSQVIN